MLKKRNLSGVYFAIFNSDLNKYETRVFEDISEDEQDEILANLSTDWLISLVKNLAKSLRGIGDKYDIISDEKQFRDYI